MTGFKRITEIGTPLYMLSKTGITLKITGHFIGKSIDAETITVAVIIKQ